MPARAASHILADHGPIMLQKGNYMLPPGHLAQPLSMCHLDPQKTFIKHTLDAGSERVYAALSVRQVKFYHYKS